MRFNKRPIYDPAVGNMEGATLLVPDGWMMEGGFVWNPNLSMQASLLLRVSDGRGGAAETLPSQQFVWPMQQMGLGIQPGANWMGSILLPPPRDPVQVVWETYVPGPLQHLRNARPTRVDNMPQLAAEFARTIPSGLNVQASRIRWEYGYSGQNWEEDVYLVTTFGQNNGYTLMWWTNAHTLRAPAGQLDRLTPLLSVPMQSLRLSLDWSAMLEYVRGLFRQGMAQEIANTQRLGQIATQHREEIRQMHQQTWQEQQAAQDRQNFARREILGGIETYTDPFTSRPVEVPTGYSNCWVNTQGDVIASETSGFDPRPGSADDWRPMPRYSPYG